MLKQSCPWTPFEGMRGSGSIDPRIFNLSVKETSVVSDMHQHLFRRGSLLGPRGSLDVLENRKFRCFCRESNHWPPVVQVIVLTLAKSSFVKPKVDFVGGIHRSSPRHCRQRVCPGGFVTELSYGRIHMKFLSQSISCLWKAYRPAEL